MVRDVIYVALWIYLAFNINKSVVKMLQSNVSTASRSVSASAMLYPSMTVCPKPLEVSVGADNRVHQCNAALTLVNF